MKKTLKAITMTKAATTMMMKMTTITTKIMVKMIMTTTTICQMWKINSSILKAFDFLLCC